MTIFKKLTALILVLLMLPLGLTAQAAEENTQELVRRLINYYHHYQQDAQLDCKLILEQIEVQDPELAATWTDILDFWASVNDDMEFHSNVLPDGLPEDDSLCIVVMGYQLHSDGDMREELEQRMKVTLESAQKYPNAYIMCTGGGTAANNSRVTEASQMAKWLKKKGIDPDRIIVENQAFSTIQNATYGCPLLYREYPQVKNLAIITSDYHIYRSCLYFHVEAALEAYDAGVEPMKVISNATCRINPGASRDIDRQTEGIGMLAKQKDVEKDSPKPLTRLETITVAGQSEYICGGQLNLMVIAHYSNGLTRNVTEDSEFSVFDMEKPGFQSITAYYEGLSADFDIYVIPPETQPVPTEPQAEETEPVPLAPEASPDTVHFVFFVIPVLLFLLIVLLILKARRDKKRRRRPRPTIKLD